LRNCAQAHAIALVGQGKACSKVQSVVFMQRSEMKKILGKFKKSTFAYFFALEKVRRNC
jgi:hypothetical protein